MKRPVLNPRAPAEPAPAALPPFEQLVRAAYAVDAELREFDTPARRKLSAGAFFREQLAAAGSTPEKIARLRDDIEQGTTHGIFEVRSVLRRMVAFVRSPNVYGACRDARRLRHMLTDYAASELSLLGASSLELFALAAQITAEKHPEAFGESPGTETTAQRMAQLKATRDELYQRIATEFTPGDLAYSDLDASGRARVSFKLTGSAVPLYPTQTAGERLVGWLSRQQAKKESG
jgi:hypothetical protein